MRFLQVANESIGFQTSAFADAVTAEFKTLFEKFISPSDADKHPSRKNIEQLIAKHTGLKIDLDLACDYPPCTMPIRANTNHIFDQDWMKELVPEDASKLFDKAEKRKNEGSINLKEGKLYGSFTKAEAPIYMGVAHLQGYKLTPAECTAILLHEVGHVFTFLEYMTRSIRTNQVLAGIHKSLLANNTKDEHKIILERGGRLLNGDDGAFIELTEIKDKQTVTTVILHKAFFSENRSDLGAASKNYDSTSAEQLADQFAARQGLGRELVSGLEKVLMFYGSPEYSTSARISCMFWMLIATIFLPVYVIIMTGSLGASLIVGAIWATLLCFYSGDNHRDRTYDDLRVRYQRIREQSIQFLKDGKVPDKEAKKVIEDIKIIDAALLKVKDYEFLTTTISNFIFPSNRAAMKAADLQRDMEALAANDIFVKAKELSFLK